MQISPLQRSDYRSFFLLAGLLVVGAVWVSGFPGDALTGSDPEPAWRSCRQAPDPLGTAASIRGAGPTWRADAEVAGPSGGEAGDLRRSGDLWTPLEWTLSNPGYGENPFDLVATVAFRHEASGERRVTEMFYDGGDRWKFRFLGTRTGRWTFETRSEDPDLDGHRGTVDVCPDPGARGILTTRGNRFARPVGATEVEPVMLKVFQEASGRLAESHGIEPKWDISQWTPEFVEDYAEMAREHGMNAIGARLWHQVFEAGALSARDHDRVRPSVSQFRQLDMIIRTARAEGVGLHFWAWGDEERMRQRTPVHLPGGINGEVDRRLQRYFAARLGPLPGWTMNYGYDLWDGWATDEQVNRWAEYMHDRMGWDHLLWARDRAGPHLDVESVGGNGPVSYEEVLSHRPEEKPHFEEERFLYGRSIHDGLPNAVLGPVTGREPERERRSVVYTMEHSTDLLWWMAMMGGTTGGWWGTGTEPGSESYPQPEWLRTHDRFWRDRLAFDMEPANHLSDGYALATSDRSRLVFFEEETSLVVMDLREMPDSAPAVAVDARAAYEEIDLGRLPPARLAWQAPRTSDWAVAVGEFRGR